MRQIIILLSMICLVISCGSVKGEFAFKTFYDDTYRRLNKELEFNSKDEIKWVYIVKNPPKWTKIGVLLMKKEVVWVDVKTAVDYVDSSKNIIYGTIKDLQPGDYQVILTKIDDEGKLIDEFKFSIYRDDEDDD